MQDRNNISTASNAPPADYGETLVVLGRALADPLRVRILGLLARGPLYGQELAAKLRVTPPTISRHMALLKAAGLVRVQRQNTTHYYHLDGSGLRYATGLLSIEKLQQLAESSQMEEAAREPNTEGSSREKRDIILSVFFQHGRLVSIPATLSRQLEIRRVVLERIAQAFELGRIYSEVQVSELLREFNEDTENLRAALLEEKLLTRDRGRYWITFRPE